MNEIEKILNEKLTENGDKSYKSTGNNLTDLLFMTPFFEKNLDQATIGTSEKEKLFSMFIRDPRFGLGRRDLGRRLMAQAQVSPKYIVTAGRFDDLCYIPTNENIEYLRQEVLKGNELAKKWLPSLTKKYKKGREIAKALCKMWDLTPKQYRALKKCESTTEYKLAYAEKNEGVDTPLNDLFYQHSYTHPLVDKIEFEQVPSLAMKKYLHTFSTREDIKPRFEEYIKQVKENKAKINTSTTNVMDAYETATTLNKAQDVELEAREVVSKKIVDDAMLNVELNAIVILDTSGSMQWGSGKYKPIDKANAIAYALSTHSTYAPNQIISFSSRPQLMTIKGETMKEKYNSMYTGDCSNTDFGAVMKLLQGLNKYPEYLVVLSDMEFDNGSSMSKQETMKLFKDNGANTKIIWWNLNQRNKTTPEFDEYGNIYLSGYNMQILRLLENKFDMTTYIDKILDEYKKDIEYNN